MFFVVGAALLILVYAIRELLLWTVWLLHLLAKLALLALDYRDRRRAARVRDA